MIRFCPEIYKLQYFWSIILIYKSTTFKSFQSTIYTFIMPKYLSTIYKYSEKKVVDSTANIGPNLQSTKSLPPPKKKHQFCRFYNIFLLFLQYATSIWAKSKSTQTFYNLQSTILKKFNGFSILIWNWILLGTFNGFSLCIKYFYGVFIISLLNADTSQ